LTMHVTFICCPFQTSYGWYAESLKQAVERKTGSAIDWVASNCGCGDPIEVGKRFQTQDCEYFELPHVRAYESKTAWKRWARVRVRHFSYLFRAWRYQNLSKDSELIHFQQILNAYGSSVVFHWLKQHSKAARVITVHELDSYQVQFPEKNKLYNKADAIIVHCDELKRKLADFGVQPDSIHVVFQGASLPEFVDDKPREGLVFYGGHKLMSGKGIRTLFKAMAILKERLDGNAPALKVHGHYGDRVPEEAQRLAEQFGVADKIVWLKQLSMNDMVQLYQTSLLLVLSYTGGFAGLPAAVAAGNRLPVVSTPKAGIPDHLGECGVWVEEENPQDLAERILELLNDPARRCEIGAKLRKRAELYLNWDSIADRTLAVYASAVKNKSNRTALGTQVR